jgi:hypothetical protein
MIGKLTAKVDPPLECQKRTVLTYIMVLKFSAL